MFSTFMLLFDDLLAHGQPVNQYALADPFVFACIVSRKPEMRRLQASARPDPMSGKK